MNIVYSLFFLYKNNFQIKFFFNKMTLLKSEYCVFICIQNFMNHLKIIICFLKSVKQLQYYHKVNNQKFIFN